MGRSEHADYGDFRSPCGRYEHCDLRRGPTDDMVAAAARELALQGHAEGVEWPEQRYRMAAEAALIMALHAALGTELSTDRGPSDGV